MSHKEIESVQTPIMVKRNFIKTSGEYTEVYIDECTCDRPKENVLVCKCGNAILTQEEKKYFNKN